MPTFVQARSDGVAWAPLQVPEGEDFADYVYDVANGLRSKPVPRFVVNGSQARIGDMLWTTGPDKLVGPRLATTLERIGAAGYRLLPVIVEWPDGRPVIGFRRMVAEGGRADDVRTLEHGQQVHVFIASDRLLDAMKHDGSMDVEFSRDLG